MITVHPAPSHTTAKTGGVTGTTDGTEAAAGDLFAALMAALMPQATVTDVAAPTVAPTTAAGAKVAAVAGQPGATDDAAKDPTALLATGVPTAAVPGVETATAALAAHGPQVAAPDGHAVADTAKAGEKDGKVVDLTTATTGTAPTAGATSTALLNPALAPAHVAERATGDGTETEAETAETTAGSVDAVAGNAKKDAVPVASTLEDSIETPTTHHVAEAPHQPVVHAVENPHADTTPVAAPMPHQQLAAVIAPLRRGADGEYRLAIRLRPEHLGTVDVDVQLHHGTVEVHVHTEHADAHHLLSEHLDDLRRELENAGLRTGNLDVSERGDNRQAQAGDGQGQRSPVGPNPTADGPANPTSTNRDAARPVQDGSVDIDI